MLTIPFTVIKTHLVLSFVLLMSSVGLAQSNSAQTQVNIVIAQMQGISISQPSVDIYLNQLQQFSTGISSAVQTDHIRVGSTTNYEVSFHAISGFLSLNGNNTTIPVQTIELDTSIGSDLTGNNNPPPNSTFIYPSVPLNFMDSVLITNGAPEGGRGYNITYTIPAYNMNYFLNQVDGTYTTTIIYTLTSL